MKMATPPPAADDFSDDEASQYGLKDLARLPLLEQIHRLFHAIQQKYPYTETAAWQSLPLEQKRRMLAYIRDRRAKKEELAATPAAPVTTPTVAAGEGAPVATAAATSSSTPAPATRAVKTDPYLQMLQKRTLLTTPTPAAALHTHPSSSYAAGQQQLAQYVERRAAAAKSRWKVVDAEFYDNPQCACGETHEPVPLHDKSDKSLLPTMRAMLSTFGDHTRPCLTTVKHVKGVGTFEGIRSRRVVDSVLIARFCCWIVGGYLCGRLSSLMEDGEVHATCLRVRS
jgi:hypothetical protein